MVAVEPGPPLSRARIPAAPAARGEEVVLLEIGAPMVQSASRVTVALAVMDGPKLAVACIYSGGALWDQLARLDQVPPAGLDQEAVAMRFAERNAAERGAAREV